MAEIETHKRVNDILLGPLERPVLKWFARHMPAWINSDILTGLGVFGAFLILVSYALTNLDRNYLWLANLGFVINWFGDSLDGTLARYRKIERPRFGFFVDHTVDAASQAMIFLGLGASPYMRFDLACLTLIMYLLMSVLVYVQMFVSGVFRIAYIGLGPTEVRIIAIIGTVLTYFFDVWRVDAWGVKLTILDLVGIGLSVLMMSAYIVVVIKQSIELSRLEQIKP